MASWSRWGRAPRRGAASCGCRARARSRRAGGGGSPRVSSSPPRPGCSRPPACLVRNLPIAGRAMLAGSRQLDPALEEAAASLGAGRWATLWRVTLPLLAPALAAGASLAFVTALGDFVTSIVLYTYDTRPISMEILSSLRLNELGLAAAFGVVLMVTSAAVLGIGVRRGNG